MADDERTRPGQVSRPAGLRRVDPRWLLPAPPVAYAVVLAVYAGRALDADGVGFGKLAVLWYVLPYAVLQLLLAVLVTLAVTEHGRRRAAGLPPRAGTLAVVAALYAADAASAVVYLARPAGVVVGAILALSVAVVLVDLVLRWRGVGDRADVPRLLTVAGCGGVALGAGCPVWTVGPPVLAVTGVMLVVVGARLAHRAQRPRPAVAGR